MTLLPTHSFTGLQAIGFRRDGRPIYPICGSSQPVATPPTPVPTPAPGDPAPTPTSPPGPNPTPAPTPDDGTLGPAGERALAAEREARRALEKQLADLAPLKQLADALGGKATGDGKTDLEALTARLSQHEAELASERAARYRVEVAAEKGLTPAQAKWLVGTTRDELVAAADQILRDFPVAPLADPRRPAGSPRPDPSQGSRGPAPLSGREAGLAEAQKRFGVKSTAT